MKVRGDTRHYCTRRLSARQDNKVVIAAHFIVVRAGGPIAPIPILPTASPALHLQQPWYGSEARLCDFHLMVRLPLSSLFKAAEKIEELEDMVQALLNCFHVRVLSLSIHDMNYERGDTEEKDQKGGFEGFEEGRQGGQQWTERSMHKDR